MSENLSKFEYSIIKRLPHPVLKHLKLYYRQLRFYRALHDSRFSICKYPKLYSNKVLFVAGLPKSGTSWLESMLQNCTGYSMAPDPRVTEWEYKHNGSHKFEMSENYFKKLKNKCVLLKLHCHASRNNLELLKKLNVPYVIMYRDLRDAAVSYVYYVKRTPWHPEHPVYKKLDISSGLQHFGKTLLREWRDWIVGWEQNYDSQKGIIITYEEMKSDPVAIFSRVTNHFQIEINNIREIVEDHGFERMKKAGSFFRKGQVGDWKNYFDAKLKNLYKQEIAAFLVEKGYEKNSDW